MKSTAPLQTNKANNAAKFMMMSGSGICHVLTKTKTTTSLTIFGKNGVKFTYRKYIHVHQINVFFSILRKMLDKKWGQWLIEKSSIVKHRPVGKYMVEALCSTEYMYSSVTMGSADWHWDNSCPFTIYFETSFI